MSDYLQPLERPIVPSTGTVVTRFLDDDTPSSNTQVTLPLEILDFDNDAEGHLVGTAFVRIRDFLLHGFNSPYNTPCPVPRSLWLRTVSELLSTILSSVRRTHGDSPLPTIFSDLNLTESSLVELTNRCATSLNDLFEDYKDDPDLWETCRRCLEACHLPVSAEQLTAVLMSCGQDLNAAQTTIINQKLRQTHLELDDWADNAKARTIDAVITGIISETDPSSLINFTDDRLSEWVSRTKNNLRDKARVAMTNETIIETLEPWASEAFADAKGTLLHKHDADLETIRSKLAAAKESARQEAEHDFATFKHNLAIESEERKNKARDAAFASLPPSTSGATRTSRPKRRTNPISRSRSHSRAPSTPSPHKTPRQTTAPLPELSQLSDIPTDVSMGPPTQLSNPSSSFNVPTDSAIRAAVDAPEWSRQLVDVFQTGLTSIRADVASLANRIHDLETKSSQPQPYTPSRPAPEWQPTTQPQTNPTPSTTWGRVDTNDKFADYDEPELLDLEQMAVEDERNYQIDTAAEKTFRALYNVPGPNLLSTDDAHRFEEFQKRWDLFTGDSSLDPTVPLIKSDFPKYRTWEQDQRGIDLNALALAPPAPRSNSSSNTTAPPTLPTPPSPGTWCTIGKSGKISYAGATAAARPPQTTTQSPQPPQPTAKPVITIAQAFQTLTTDTLNAMTKDQIIGAFQMRFGSRLPQRLTKTALIQRYVTRSQATATPNPQPQPPTNDKPKVVQSTEITVIRDSSAVSLSQTREPADARVRQLQQELRRAGALNEKSPLSLISGRWSAQNSPNFVLVFAGQPELDLIMKYRRVLVAPFGPGCSIAPQRGYSRILLNGIPIIRNLDGSPPNQKQLFDELAINPVAKGLCIIAPPRWLRQTLPTDAVTASITFAIIDPDGNATSRIIKQPPSLFGATSRAIRFVSKPVMRQCTRCWRLSHTESRCPRPANTLVCPICGGRHKADEHHAKCPNRATHTDHIRCTCKPSCIGCRQARLPCAGHIVTSPSCPLRHKYRTPQNRTGDSSDAEQQGLDSMITEPTPPPTDNTPVPTSQPNETIPDYSALAPETLTISQGTTSGSSAPPAAPTSGLSLCL